MSNIAFDKLIAEETIVFSPADENAIRAYQADKAGIFYVDGYDGSHHTFHFIKGMTWREFLNSSAEEFSFLDANGHLSIEDLGNRHYVYIDIPASNAFCYWQDLEDPNIDQNMYIQDGYSYFADMQVL